MVSAGDNMMIFSGIALAGLVSEAFLVVNQGPVVPHMLLSLGVFVLGLAGVIVTERSGRERPDYRHVLRHAIDIPFHTIEEYAVEARLRRGTVDFNPRGCSDGRRQFVVRLSRVTRHPDSIIFAKRGTVPTQVYYRVDVRRQNPNSWEDQSLWTAEYADLASALREMSSYATPLQTVVVPALPAPESVPVNGLGAIQAKIDARETKLESVRLKKYPNRGLSLADVGMLEGDQAYLALLKERDELMWAADQEQGERP